MVSAALHGVGIVLAALGGAALGVQAGTNSTLGIQVGKGVAGLISFASGFFCILIFFLVSTYAAKAQGPSVIGFRGTLYLFCKYSLLLASLKCSCNICRNSLVGLHRGYPWCFCCDRGHHFCSAAGEWHCVWCGSHRTTDHSNMSRLLWHCGLRQATSFVA